jgi:transcriptional regulator with XRE-family HTH domain
MDIGAKVKRLRTKKKMTLKQLSEKTGLSTGFLSQFERGISTVAIDSLSSIAKSLGVELRSFFGEDAPPQAGPVIRSFERCLTQTGLRTVEGVLSLDVTRYNFLPRVFELMPSGGDSEISTEVYHHTGEEFIYVLEGILTLFINGKEYSLYPGDSVQLSSVNEHNWANRTNHIVRFLQVNCPNPYLSE